MVAGRDVDVELGVGAVADLRRRIFSGERRQLRGGAADQGLVASLVVAGGVGSSPGLRDNLRAAAHEFDDIGTMEDVLIESGEEENLVALERTADCASELLLAVVRLERLAIPVNARAWPSAGWFDWRNGLVQKIISRTEGTVAEMVEGRSVQVIGAGLGDNVDDGAAGAALFGAVGRGGDAEFLHNFGGDFVGSAIASTRLGKEGVVEVAAVDQEAVLESPNAADREIAVGGGIQAARVLRDAGREQGKIGETAAVQGEIAEGALVEERGDAVGLGFDQGGCAGDGNTFVGAGDGEVEI